MSRDTNTIGKTERRRADLARAIVVYLLLWLACGACKTTEETEVESATVSPTDPSVVAPGSESTTGSSSAGVKTTYSGLKYQVLRPGTGRRPSSYNRVKVHYRGTLMDGTVFDSSYQRGQPAVFRLDQVIPGWTEGLGLMREGAKYRFIIPPNLAYGSAGSPPKIGPNQTLKFDVELLEVLY